MTDLAKLVVKMEAENAQLLRKLEQSEKRFSKFSRDTVRVLDVVNKAILGVGASAGVLSAVTVQTVRAAEEVSRLSRVANTSAQDFQKFASGASAFGVQQEKLADILKDTTDKVGDFLQTGGGPMADFFENIAPKVGVTAEQFKNLSGRDALQLYVSSLEKANVSQNEMTFYMEAIASDATLLLPLLKDNGEAMKFFGDAADRAGAILSDKALKSASELNATMFLFEQSMKGAKNQMVEGFLPSLVQISALMFDTAENTDTFRTAGENLGRVLGDIAAFAVGPIAAFDLLGKKIGGAAAIVAAFSQGEFARAGRIYDDLSADLDDTKNEYLELQKKLDAIGEGGPASESTKNFNQRVQKLAEYLEESRKAALGAGGAIDRLGGNAAKGLDSLEKKAESVKKSLLDIEKEFNQRIIGLSAPTQKPDEELNITDLDAGLRDAQSSLRQGDFDGAVDKARQAFDIVERMKSAGIESELILNHFGEKLRDVAVQAQTDKLADITAQLDVDEQGAVKNVLDASAKMQQALDQKPLIQKIAVISDASGRTLTLDGINAANDAPGINPGIIPPAAQQATQPQQQYQPVQINMPDGRVVPMYADPGVAEQFQRDLEREALRKGVRG